MIKILLTGVAEKNRQPGFSLVELLVVLTIMSVLVGSISFLMFNNKETLRTLSSEIVQNMRLVQQRAVRENLPYQVEIDFINNTFFFPDESVELSKDVSITVRTAANQQIEKDLVGVTFYPDSSSSGGVVTLETETESVVITLIWISGKIITEHHVKTS